MTALVDIAHAPYGEICAIAGSIWEIKEAQGRISLTIVDDGGAIVATYFDYFPLVEKFKKDDDVIIRGKVEIFGGLKAMTNPQIFAYAGGDLPFEDEKLLIPSAKTRSQILANYSPEEIDVRGKTFLITKEKHGDLCDWIKHFASDGKEIQIVCPLAYKTTLERNALVPNYEKNHAFPELKFYPDVCIDLDIDCECATEENLAKRYKYWKSVANGANVHCATNAWKHCDVLVVEDAERFSILEIDKIRKRTNCHTFICTNSTKKEQLERLQALEQTSDLNALFQVEFAHRRPGELERLA